MICETIYNRRGSIIECGKIMITKFDENSSSSQCELDSSVQGAGKGIEEGERKTN